MKPARETGENHFSGGSVARISVQRRPERARGFETDFADGLQAGVVVVREFSEGKPEHNHRRDESNSREQPGTAIATPGHGVIHAGKPTGREKSNPPVSRIEMEQAALHELEHHSRQYLARHHNGDRDEHLRHGHQTVQPLAAEPAQTKLIGQHDTAGAEQGFEHRGDDVNEREQNAAVRQR